jgi:hypothetical protein
MGTGTGKDTGQGGRKALADWGGCAQRHYQHSKLGEGGRRRCYNTVYRKFGSMARL